MPCDQDAVAGMVFGNVWHAVLGVGAYWSEYNIIFTYIARVGEPWGKKSLCMKVKYKGGSAHAITNVKTDERNLDNLMNVMAKGMRRDELTWSST